MKADMNKLGVPTERPPEKKKHSHINMARGVTNIAKGITNTNMARGVLCVMASLIIIGGAGIWYQSSKADTASADELYDPSQADPQFVVQHMADIEIPVLKEDGGTVTFVTEKGVRYADKAGDGTPVKTVSRVALYDDYETSWTKTDSIAGMSFLNGVNGERTDGYILSEIWFGADSDSENQSDFLVLEVPLSGGHEDLSKIMLTNNPEHPKLSETAGGYYRPDENGNYVICISNKSVVRLIFKEEELRERMSADMYDYDVSDGGYYLEDDYFNRKEQHATSGQSEEKEAIFVDATEYGIHSSRNYAGSGAKFAFGKDSIGTDLSDEVYGSGLDTINVYNYGNSNGTGISENLVDTVTKDGLLRWTDGISAPALFGGETASGKTSYISDEFGLTFGRLGFTSTLLSAEYNGMTAASGLDSLNSCFWIMDDTLSSGTDGHDPLWGNGSELIQYYRTNDRGSLPFSTSVDGKDHNSFFGFSWTKDFTVPAGYTGPLSVYGYSDDDMWVFAGQTDEQGELMPETVFLAADLGGVHGRCGYYADLWDHISKVPYGEDETRWRLYVFWLERDGDDASCGLSFTVPEKPVTDIKETAGITVEAASYDSSGGVPRTFVFNDGTYDRYYAIDSNGKEQTVVSGEEFLLDGGCFLNIEGVPLGRNFTVKETGRENVWHSTGNSYSEGNSIQGTIQKGIWASFLSALNSGTMTIRTDAEDEPENGFDIKLHIEGAPNTEISAMDEHSAPIGSKKTDDNGDMIVTLPSDGLLTLYNLPDGTPFWIEPAGTPGWHVEQVLVDGDGVEAQGARISGTFPAYAAYRYVADPIVAPRILLEQSVSGDWGTEDISLKTGALISYKISVLNPNATTSDVHVKDQIPEGLELVSTSLLEGYADGNTVFWDITLKGGETAELSFTCTVTGNSGEISNQAVIEGNESNISKIIIP